MGNIYSNTIRVIQAIIPAGQTTSGIVDCTTSSQGMIPPSTIAAQGMTTLRKIKFPSNWTTCSLLFSDYDSLTDVSPTTVAISDTTITTDLAIPNCTAGRSLILLPFWTDSLGYFSITCNVAQVNTVTIRFYFQPIYQGVA